MTETTKTTSEPLELSDQQKALLDILRNTALNIQASQTHSLITIEVNKDNGEFRIFAGGYHPPIFLLGVITDVQNNFMNIVRANNIKQQEAKNEDLQNERS